MARTFARMCVTAIVGAFLLLTLVSAALAEPGALLSVESGPRTISITLAKPDPAQPVRLLRSLDAPAEAATPDSLHTQVYQGTYAVYADTDLQDGTIYHYAAFTPGPDGDWLRVSTTFAQTWAPTELRFGSTQTVTAGGFLRLTGSLHTAQGLPLPGNVIVIERYGKAGWEEAAQVTTDMLGGFQFSRVSTKSANYRARFAGVSSADRTFGHLAVASPSVNVRVVSKITVNAATSRAAVGSRVVLKGTVRPFVFGRRVYVQRYQGGKWLPAASAKVNRRGEFSVSFRPPAKGKYQLSMYVAGDARSAASRTPSRTIGVYETRILTKMPLVAAHAGGRVSGLTYTNSREALDLNYRRGFRMFEMDISWTTDGKLVMLHDWNGSMKRLFNRSPGRLSLHGFRSLKMSHGLHQMSFDDLAAWLLKHPDAYIITDVKQDNLAALGRIASDHPEIMGQVVPQIYSGSEWQPARREGFSNIILTLYRGQFSDADVLRFVKYHRVAAVTIDKRKIMRGSLGVKLKAAGVKVFAHTVNDRPLADSLRARGAHGVYTDDLRPR